MSQSELQQRINTLGDGYQIVPMGNNTDLLKVVKDGKTAVAVSYGFSAGWSTWCKAHSMDAKFNVLFLTGKKDEVKELCKQMEYYDGGVKGVKIEWVEAGKVFKISEYDGSESISYCDRIKWNTA
jgi:hypothetical protein